MEGRTRAEGRWPSSAGATFLTFFAGGVLAIMVLKAWGAHQIIVTATPCAFMVVYAWLLWDFDEQRPRSDAAGDNLYYLGFLYTLTSLALSLYQFSANEGDADVIVTNFGIAIFTTILGMTLRVVFGQATVEDLSTKEVDARESVAAAGQELRAEMLYTVDEFREFRTRVRKVLQATSLQKAVAHFEQAVRTAADGLVDRTQQLERSANRLTAFGDAAQHLHERTSELAAGSVAVRESLREQAERLRAIDLREPLLEALDPAFAAVRASVDDAAAQVGTRVDSVLQVVEQQTARLTASTDTVRDALQSQAERLRDMDVQQAFLDGAVRPVSNDLRAATGRLSSLVDQLRETDADRRRALGNVEEAAQALIDALHEDRNLVETVATTMRDARDATATLQSASQRIGGFAEGLQDTAGQVADARDGLSQSADRVTESTRDLTVAADTLASLVHETGAAGRRSRRWFRWWRR